MQERRLAPRGVTAALLCAVAARCDINAVGAVLEAGASPLRRPPPRARSRSRTFAIPQMSDDGLRRERATPARRWSSPVSQDLTVT